MRKPTQQLNQATINFVQFPFPFGNLCAAAKFFTFRMDGDLGDFRFWRQFSIGDLMTNKNKI